MNITSTPLRQSFRHAPVPPVPLFFVTTPATAELPLDSDASDSDADVFPTPPTGPDGNLPDSDDAPDESPQHMLDTAVSMELTHDRHALAWRALRDIRRRQMPPVGRPPASTKAAVSAPTADQLVALSPPADPITSHHYHQLIRSRNMTRFGPAPLAVLTTTSASTLRTR